MPDTIGRNQDTSSVPAERYDRLFWRFLRFGMLAWGGPMAQIAMIRQELVEEEKWISPNRFNRVLAIYQMLPGPEATELCVYFGLLSRGRPGGLLAGLGFVLPGFALMLLLSWVYVTFGIGNAILASAFAGLQPAVTALVVRAVYTIGRHALANRWLLGIAILSLMAQLLNVHFAITLAAVGVAYTLVERRQQALAVLLGIGLFVGVLAVSAGIGDIPVQIDSGRLAATAPSPLTLFISGLRAGLLTFGGAYTVIPFLQHDAVEVGRWMTNARFLDGLALSGILPAPLIIFSTFVGYIGGGFTGAVVMTVGIFLPAFLFTLVGHETLEKLVENRGLHAFLDGVTAGVVGLIAAASLSLALTAIRSLPALILFCAALIALFRWKAKISVPVVMLAAGLAGFVLFGGQR